MRYTRPSAAIPFFLLLSSCGESSPCPPIEDAPLETPPPGAWVDPTTIEYAPELGVDFTQMSELAEGLYCVDTEPGGGAESEPGATVQVHYTGYHPDGSSFDSSVGGNPFSVLLGVGRVIPGWDLGLRGMRVGGRRTIVIPPHLAYGPQGAGEVIPPNAVLVFEVELVDMD